MLQIVTSLNDDIRGFIYNCNIFIIHAINVLSLEDKLPIRFYSKKL
jgi:hypothetical protein